MGQTPSVEHCDDTYIKENKYLNDTLQRYDEETSNYKYKVEQLCKIQNTRLAAQNEVLKNTLMARKAERDYWKEIYNRKRE